MKKRMTTQNWQCWTLKK